MKEKHIPTPQNMKEIAEKHGLIAKNRKYSQYEILSAIDKHLTSQEARIEKAKKVYKEQRAKIKELSSPKLWSFAPTNPAPPDYTREYMRRLQAGESLAFGVKVEKRQDS